MAEAESPVRPCAAARTRAAGGRPASRLLARARTLSLQSAEELDEAIGQEPRLLDVALTGRHAGAVPYSSVARNPASSGPDGSGADPRS